MECLSLLYKNMIGSNNDKHGIITIDSLQLGEYVFAMKDYAMSIQPQTLRDKLPELKVFPNPAKDNLTVELDESVLKLAGQSVLIISDSSGKVVYKENIDQHQTKVNINTSAYTSGMYTISLHVKNTVVAKNKFVIAH